MHDPIALDTFRRTALVEDQGLFDPDTLGVAVDRLVRSRGLPVPRHGCPVRSEPVGVLSVSRGEEVPLLLPELGLLYNSRNDSLRSDHYQHSNCNCLFLLKLRFSWLRERQTG